MINPDYTLCCPTQAKTGSHKKCRSPPVFAAGSVYYLRFVVARLTSIDTLEVCQMERLGAQRLAAFRFVLFFALEFSRLKQGMRLHDIPNLSICRALS